MKDKGAARHAVDGFIQECCIKTEQGNTRVRFVKTDKQEHKSQLR